MNSLRPLWRKTIPVNASGTVKAKTLFMLLSTRIPLWHIRQSPKPDWGAAEPCLYHVLWLSGLPTASRGRIHNWGKAPSISVNSCWKRAEEWKWWQGQLSCGSGFPWWTKINTLMPIPLQTPMVSMRLTGGSNPKGPHCRQRCGTPSGLASFGQWIIRDSSNYNKHYLDKQIKWLWTRQYSSLFRSITTVAFFHAFSSTQLVGTQLYIFQTFVFLLIFFKRMSSRMQVASNEQKDKHKECQFQVPRHGKTFFCIFA